MNEHFVYWVNGLLLMLYAVWRIKFAVLGLALALLVLGRYGTEQAETAGHKTLRYERGTVNTLGASYWLSRFLAIGLWTAGALLAPTDIEGLWSLVMWIALLVTLQAIPPERPAILFRHLWMLAFYGCGMVVLRLLIGANVNLGRAMSLLHVSGNSQVLFDTVRTSIMPYAGALMWALYPIGFLAALAQRFQIIRGALGARGRPQQVVTGLTHRGEDLRRSPRQPVDAQREDW